MEASPTSRRLRAAILLSTESFEDFFEGQLGYDRERYVSEYRNDWAWDYCKALSAAGVDPLLYVASYGANDSAETADGYRVRFLSITGGYAPWRRAPVLKRTPVGRFVAQLANTRAFLPALRAGLREDEVDVLAIQEYWTGRYDLLATRLGHVPLLAIDQGLPDRRELKWLKRRTLPRAHRIITQTEEEAGKVRRYGGAAERIPNGVDLTLFSPADPPRERERTVLVAARLFDYQKRISDLIAALALLPADWHLDVVGDGPDGASLRGAAARLGVADRVDFHGFLERSRLRELYRACGVFALPSAYEGLPMALLEAMACGAAPVGSDIPAIAGVITDDVDGRLVPVGEPTALAAAIEDAYTRRVELGAAARATVCRDYSQGGLGSRLSALVHDAAQARGSPGL